MQMTKLEIKNNELKKNIVLLLIVLFLFLIIFEISLRIMFYPIYGFQKKVFVYDEDLGYKPAANYSGIQTVYGRKFKVVTNDRGLRDFRNYSYNKNNGTFRILILGDSSSFGNGVNLEESYPEYLRKNFQNDNVEIINMGVPGYGINNEYAYFMKEGKKYSPDIILLQYSINDWGTHQIINENGSIKVDKNHSLIANKNGFLVSSGNEKFLRKIHLYLLWSVRSYSFIYLKSRLILSKVVDKYWALNANPSLIYDVNSSGFKEAYNGYYSILKEFKENTDAPLILFTGPSSDDLIDIEKIKKEFKLNYTIYPRIVQENIKEIAKKLNITSIEILSNDPSIFLPVDKHWNAKGNQMVANKLYYELKNKKLIKDEK